MLYWLEYIIPCVTLILRDGGSTLDIRSHMPRMLVEILKLRFGSRQPELKYSVRNSTASSGR